MQRSRNRQGQGRGSDSNNHPNDRPNRGRGRGSNQSFHPQPRANHNHPSVPNTAQIQPGVPVSIVLKVDQPTGREVQGMVQDVLTRGDHPRGIKVRLKDGRVGRVQRLVGEEVARERDIRDGSLGRNGEGGGGVAATYTDVRKEDGAGVPRAGGYSLEDFLPVGHPLRSEAPEVGVERTSEAQICPVCGKFEGDEVAVSYHVATHFD